MSTTLVTGGTGSFGHAVVRRLLQDSGNAVRVFSRDEKKQEDMRLLLANPRLSFHLGDVRDYQSVDDAMDGVDRMFHAAALKQVPSCESYPMEAFKTNVLGAENVMRAAIAHKVSHCVLLSTDKAVYPANAMGMSKAMMEKIMLAKVPRAGLTTLCATRYGNVMGSRGSVIPLFLEQIRARAPLTITDQTMTRFFMSAEDSVDLVLYALANAEPGDIFVQKAPSASVSTLITALAQLFDMVPSCRVIGVRPGEKSHELLVSPEEMGRGEDCGTYYRIPANTGGTPRWCDGYGSNNTKQLTVEELVPILREIPCVREALCSR